MSRRQGSNRQWKRSNKNSWVRPPSSEAHKWPTSNANTVNDAEKKSSTSRMNQGPILKGGPKRIHKTWKRPGSEITATVGDAMLGSSVDDANGAETVQSGLEKSTTVSSNAAQHLLNEESAMMIKRGKQQNQLVLANKPKTKETSNEIIPSLETTREQDKQIMVKPRTNKLVRQTGKKEGTQAKEEPRAEKEKTGGQSVATSNMKKRGRNKLVLGTKSHESQQRSVPQDVPKADKATFDDKERTGGDDEKKTSIMRYGRNKLISAPKASTANKGMQPNTATVNNGTKRDKARKRGSRLSSRPKVKRIKLNVVQENEGLAEHDASTAKPQAKKDTEQVPAKKLTEFAYRETSKQKRSKARRATRKKQQQQRVWSRTTAASSSSSGPSSLDRNMGLVRVVPDLATTPVCPTFARGIPCVKEKCTKRHDVPQEAARPICSFFQRNGQCLKPDTCPFRHVKVNARTTPCPSFTLLGYCQDTECQMKHVLATTKKST